MTLRKEEECLAALPGDEDGTANRNKRRDALQTGIALQRQAINNEFDQVLEQTTSGLSKEKQNQCKRALLSRALAALVGGLAVVVPMLIMVLHPTKATAIWTSSCFVVVVALCLAFLMTDSQPKDVVACTAAYAAVLIVFVGAAMGPDTYQG